jgi:hypothetical protein
MATKYVPHSLDVTVAMNRTSPCESTLGGACGRSRCVASIALFLAGATFPICNCFSGGVREGEGRRYKQIMDGPQSGFDD